MCITYLSGTQSSIWYIDLLVYGEIISICFIDDLKNKLLSIKFIIMDRMKWLKRGIEAYKISKEIQAKLESQPKLG
jgi:hypothetical protein